MSRTPRAADLVGVDFARVRTSAPRRRVWLPAALAGALLAALALAQLRISIFQLRYALGEAGAATRALHEERSRVAARLEGLRGPERLAKLAQTRGFTTPTHVIELAAPRSRSESASDPGPGLRP
jgi:hypothetical protein